MTTCSMGFDHPDIVPEPEEPIVIDNGTGEADVKVAEIEAARDVKIEQIHADVEKSAIESRVDALEGELRGMREALDRIIPEPEPEAEPEPAPIVVQEPAEPEPSMAPPESTEPKHRAPKHRAGMFGF